MKFTKFPVSPSAHGTNKVTKSSSTRQVDSFVDHPVSATRKTRRGREMKKCQ